MTQKLFTYIKTAGKHRMASGKKVLTRGDKVSVAFVEDLDRYGDAATWKALDKPAPSRGKMRETIDDDPSIVAAGGYLLSRETDHQLSTNRLPMNQLQKIVGSRSITIPRIWEDEDVFIIGGGPSLAEMNLDPIHDRCVIGVNQAFELGSWIDILFFVDQRFLDWNREAIREFPNMKLAALGSKRSDSGVKLIERSRKQTGISEKADSICYNSNGGAAAINLAVHLGAKRIFLLGFDMKTTSGKHNWHDKHQVKPKDDIYSTRFLVAFTDIRKDAEKLGIEIINLTPGSALDDFPKGSLEDYS